MTREEFISEMTVQQGALRRFLLALCSGDSCLADDIAQEAALKAYQARDSFKGRSRFSTWLFRIACNCYYDALKRSARLPSDASIDSPSALSQANPENADDHFRHEALYMAIDALSPNEKLAVLLFYMEDKSIKEIVDITGMPSGTVRSNLSRAREHLRKYLSSQR